MKVKKLVIRNIGMIADTEISLNKPLILFYGEIKQGKTTILNAVRWCFGGSYPADIIRHGQNRASVLLELDGGSISREWYIAKDGSTKDNPISFIRDGKPIKGRVVDEIKKFLNPFLLDQDHLRKMGETERKQYFTQLFAVDTSEIDKEISSCESEAKERRIKVKMYGDIDLTEIKAVDTAPLQIELQGIRKAHQTHIGEVQNKNKEIRARNQKIQEGIDDIKEWDLKITGMEKALKELKETKAGLAIWLQDNSKKDEIPLPDPPDNSFLETKISEAAATNVRAEQYLKNMGRAMAKKADERKVLELEAKQRDLKSVKISKLVQISESCKIKNLTFDESGNFTYEGTSAGMLSGSQIMKLSEELSNLYPKDLGIGLIDRAESLGKSVFLLIDRAKEEEKTILATVVGERPAEVPSEVGVWIVEKGELK